VDREAARARAELAEEERKAARAEHSAPILEEIEAWLGQQSVPPKTVLGRSNCSLRREWLRLTVFLEDGRLPLDDNGVEHGSLPFALSRKRWLFSDSVGGAESAAMLYDLADTTQV
jgi:transposase